MSLCSSSVIVSTWLVMCFPCAMCSPVNCLAPPILLSDYWLICPTCPARYHPLFVPLFSLPVFGALCWFVANVSQCLLVLHEVVMAK